MIILFIRKICYIFWGEYHNFGWKEAKTLEKMIKDNRVMIYGYSFAVIFKDIKDTKLLKNF